MNQTTNQLLTQPVRWQRMLAREPESFWINRGRRMAAKLFRDMRMHVPAYGTFLASSGKSLTVQRPIQWDMIPLISKDTYLRRFPLPSVMWEGKLEGSSYTISATSGSTGEPFYFPRTRLQDLQYSALAEMYLRTNFSIHTRSTLYIVGWGMGVWIGGVFSYEAVRIVAERGKYPLSVITAGTSKEEILKAVRRLGHYFDQVIIGGYPPMIKDLVDEGERQKLHWKKYHVKFIFSAEGFTEDFRDYIVEHAGITGIYTDTLNHYGTVDMGTMAHETPLAILVRRLARNHEGLNQQLFGQKRRQPTLAQYIPELFYFEQVNGSVVCSARSGIPLCRYDLIDTGGVLTFSRVKEACASCGIDLAAEIRKAKISDTVWNLPFVYVFERRDFTVKWQGANIYPQEIRRALETKALSAYCTGKCILEIVYDRSMDQVLAVDVELQSGVRRSRELSMRIQSQITVELLQSNSEYAYLTRQLSPKRMTPLIRLRAYGSPPFSAPGKLRWVRQ